MTHGKLTKKIDTSIASGIFAEVILAFSDLREDAQRVFTADVANAERIYLAYPFPEFKRYYTKVGSINC